MKKLLILLAAPLMLASCKKDSESTPGPTTPGGNSGTSCYLTEEKDSTNNEIDNTYEYDASKRISKILSYENGTISSYSTLSYNGNIVTIQDFKANNTADGSPYIILLNSSGYYAEQRRIHPDTTSDGIPGTASDTTLIGYNAAGQQSSFTIRSWTRNASDSIIAYSSNSTTYEFSDGRVSKSNFSFSNNKGENFNSTTTYTYSSSSPAVKSNPVIGFFSVGGSTLLGKIMSDKIPASSVTTTNFGASTYTSTSTYTAVVDAKGYPTKIRSASSRQFSNDVNTTLYTYNCP